MGNFLQTILALKWRLFVRGIFVHSRRCRRTASHFAGTYAIHQPDGNYRYMSEDIAINLDRCLVFVGHGLDRGRRGTRFRRLAQSRFGFRLRDFTTIRVLYGIGCRKPDEHQDAFLLRRTRSASACEHDDVVCSSSAEFTGSSIYQSSSNAFARPDGSSGLRVCGPIRRLALAIARNRPPAITLAARRKPPVDQRGTR